MKLGSSLGWILFGLLAFNAAKASCPVDIAQRLFDDLKTKISWVDINSKPCKFGEPCKMIVRYFPCYSSDSIMDLMLRKALNTVAPACLLQNPGWPKKVEGYCALFNVIVH